ncbi:hypothetical protein AYJ54_06345 [Bradyrhizobium centrolobii]|uniref:DUF3179 domain-containing protein n=1 Tax=Bradyrhizobium centrolobii TaxID=1505087 RepID=A0A176YXJ4_9BRAD|nr:DUF3179 domain-containing protein [Bradyrhizobium centrolobii]OAF12445.1 hypothetical protein AYJ54_06345 [Bradyrhizobium centrolobii]
MLVAVIIGTAVGQAMAEPGSWRAEWPRTDFSRHTVPLREIKSGGPPKDGIPSIDTPRFERLKDGAATGWASRIGDAEPVITLDIRGDARAYPLSVLIWHEIANDTVGGTPVAVTYCPLCNAALVFERTVENRVLDFGTTGKLRNSDLVMYDRQTESWWQQFEGDAIVGVMSGKRLHLLPSRLESFVRFRQRFPNGQVLIPHDPAARRYGINPYVGYDASGQMPLLYDGSLPDGIDPMERVVAVEIRLDHHEAWSLSLLRERGTIESGDIILRWEAGQTSALDKRTIAGGRDIGNVVVQRRHDGQLSDIPYDVTFAFAFHAFRPGSPIHKRTSIGPEN